MSKSLVIVESPSKAKTINKYLGSKFIVEATVGHVRDLPKSKLAVDVENEFATSVINIRGKGDVIKKIKSLASKVHSVYIATDPDREGEAIAADIAYLIKDAAPDEHIYRVLFNEITKNGVKRGMEDPRKIDINLVDSQRARRVMDRLIGYSVSPFLWRAIIEEASNALSAGRVQSVALRLVCEREAEIRAFIPTEFWTLKGIFQKGGKQEFKASLFSVEGKEVRIPPKPVMTDADWIDFNKQFFALPDARTASLTESEIRAVKAYAITDITKRTGKRNPPVPFITSTLQAEASRLLKMRPAITMKIAQSLYEGVELGKAGTAGLITYMRTDSTRVSNEIVADARGFIKDTYGEGFLSDAPKYYEKKKNAGVQDAHEAIRPTSMAFPPESVKEFLSKQQFQVYQLVWNRFLASQMSPATIETTTVEISGGKFVFKVSGQAILDKGFLRVYDDEDVSEEDDEKQGSSLLPAGLQAGDNLVLSDVEKKQSSTKPPPRFTESSLIKELEKDGIGRPSTYASIISTITFRQYVTIRERKLYTTPRGERVNETLVQFFPDIFDVTFTAKMETELDSIANGELSYVQALNDFYSPFSKTLAKVESKVEKILCEQCGNEMIMKMGRFGRFLACSNYPECSSIKSLRDYAQENQEPEYTGEACPKCNGRTVYRTGKFGKFIGCENYPKCDYLKNITLNIPCPKCTVGEVTERKSRRNKVFYGCNRYPECDFTSWNKPVEVPCDECTSTYLEEKYTAKKGKYLKCPACGAEKQQDIEKEEDE